jgi:tRNA A37 threonylcarbamoyltransferase TsaD
VSLFIPEPKLTTDNAVMIAVASYLRHFGKGTQNPRQILAEGHLRLSV